MSDESGGDFGGGSVRWRITTGKEKEAGRERDKEVDVGGGVRKNRNSGVDEGEIEDNFSIKLKVPNNSEDKTTLSNSLEQAKKDVDSGKAFVTIQLKIAQVEDQVRVIWKGHSPSVTRATSA